MKMKKGLLALLCIVAIMASAIFGTLAYLTDAEAVVNTFSVGKVHLKLDEAPVDENGKETEGDRVHANEYHILPGQTYDKDPTVTVLAGSEKSYVRILMTVYNASAVQAIIDADNDSGNDVKDYANLFGGWENGMWLYEDFTTDSVANTIKNVPVGDNYTIVEKESWSWRYDASNGTQSATVKGGEETIVPFSNNRNRIYWLSGDNYCKNLFSGVQPTE